MLPSPPVARDPSSLKVCRSQGPWSSTDKPPLAGLLPFVEDCVCVCVFESQILALSCGLTD